MDRKKRQVINNISGGRNGFDPPWAIADNQSADAVNVDPIQSFALRCGRPGAAQQVNCVTARNYPTENLLKVKLCTASLGIPAILPV